MRALVSIDSSRLMHRARETDCGALLIRLLFRKYVRDLNWSVKIHPTVVIAPSTHPLTLHGKAEKDASKKAAVKKRTVRDEHDPCLDFVHGLVELLDSHIAAATANLAQASQRTPMHGV